MIFTSLTFLAFYALLMAALLIFKGKSFRQYILLIGSYVFYGWWNPTFLLLIFASSVWGWWFGLLINGTTNERKKSAYLALSLALSIGTLSYYKYTDFLVQNIVLFFGLDWNYDLGIILPVGISFFTFQTMSYGIDLKRGRIPVCRSLPQFMLFVAFFPQLVAGPIVRASEFLPQLARDVKLSWNNFVIGGQLFLGGAVQKVLFADNLSVFVDPVFSEPALYSAGTLWLAMFAYTMQIFCDFSGYSLMAIGVARTIGFELPENFRMPYLSRSIGEFWRRWHMTLSYWLRDYLYVSMGGNRHGTTRTYLHIMVTMLLGGLWHGASWNFVLWGALHGIAMLGHRVWAAGTEGWNDTVKQTLPYRIAAWGVTFLFVSMLWIPFRSNSFADTLVYVRNLFGNDTGVSWINPNTAAILFAIAIWHSLYLFRISLFLRFPEMDIRKAYPQFVLGMILLLIALYAPINTSPFVYFQF